MNVAAWKSELFDVIRTMGDLSELRRLWLGGSPNEISSYSDDIDHLFGELDIDAFLQLDSDKVGLSERQRRHLETFRTALHEYVAATRQANANAVMDSRFILEDPGWAKISSLARDFIESLDS